MNFYTCQCEKYKQNSEKLWNIINSVWGKNNDKTSSLSYITVNGINKFKSSEICDEFAHYFSKIGENLAKKNCLQCDRY